MKWNVIQAQCSNQSTRYGFNDLYDFELVELVPLGIQYSDWHHTAAENSFDYHFK